MVEFLRLNPRRLPRRRPGGGRGEGAGLTAGGGSNLPFPCRVIGLMQPTDSWAGKWLRLEKFVPGAYAIQCSSDLPSELEGLLEDLNINWHRRE